jgi:hypothetical protein
MSGKFQLVQIVWVVEDIKDLLYFLSGFLVRNELLK